MQNHVFINDEGYVEAAVVGDQSEDTFRHLYDEAQPLIEKLRQSGKPVLALIDLTQKGKYTPGSNKAAMQLLEGISYDRVAMFGAEAVLKEVTELIILAMGKNDNTKLFHTREEAVAWLLNPVKAAA